MGGGVGQKGNLEEKVPIERGARTAAFNSKEEGFLT